MNTEIVPWNLVMMVPLSILRRVVGRSAGSSVLVMDPKDHRVSWLQASAACPFFYLSSRGCSFPV